MFTTYLCCRVTILKDHATRKSKGVAFVMFVEKDSAFKAVRALNRTKVLYIICISYHYIIYC